jgi:hypothetical protein
MGWKLSPSLHCDADTVTRDGNVALKLKGFK